MLRRPNRSNFGLKQQAAIDLTLQVIAFLDGAWSDFFLGGIWLSALGLAALADRAEQMRLIGGEPATDVALGQTLLDRTIETARRGRPRGGRLGPEGRAWMARATAEYGRLIGHDDPGLWQQAIDEFSDGYRYEVARSRWRRAAALAGVGDQAGARAEATIALAQATGMGPFRWSAPLPIWGGGPASTCRAPARPSARSPTGRRKCSPWWPRG